MRVVLATFAFLFFPATTVPAQQLTTKVQTTVTVFEENMTTATFAQLVRAIKSFDGRVLTITGRLYSNGGLFESEYTVIVEDGLSFQIDLDDGRQVTLEARQCPLVFESRKNPGCRVTMDVELDLDATDYGQRIRFGGVGFNVDFE